MIKEIDCPYCNCQIQGISLEEHKAKVEYIKGEVEKILINSEMEGVWELIKKEFQEEKK